MDRRGARLELCAMSGESVVNNDYNESYCVEPHAFGVAAHVVAEAT